MPLKLFFFSAEKEKIKEYVAVIRMNANQKKR